MASSPNAAPSATLGLEAIHAFASYLIFGVQSPERSSSISHNGVSVQGEWLRLGRENGMMGAK